MRMTRFSIAGVLTIAVAAVVLSLSTHAPADEPKGIALPDPSDRPAVAASVREWLAGAWKSYGYSERDAVALSERSIQRLQHQIVPDFEALDAINAGVVMHPDAEPTILIRNYLVENGVEDEEAHKYAIFAFLLANGDELVDPQEQVGVTECVVVPVVIVYCKTDIGEPRTFSTTGYFNKNCWDTKVIPFLPAVLPTCPPGEKLFYEMSINCFGADNNCAWIRIDGPSVYINVPCDATVISCDCLQQPTGQISTQCCHPRGCQGCPCDGH